MTTPDDHAGEPPDAPPDVDDLVAMNRLVEDLGRSSLDVPPALVAILADAIGRSLFAIEITDVELDAPQHERVKLLGAFARNVAQAVDDLRGMRVVLCRPGPAAVLGDDLGWYDAVRGALSVAGLHCYGVHLATPAGAIEITPLARTG